MTITGPLPTLPMPRPDENAGLMLRLNQRFNAEVLQVTGQTVVLSVQGVRIVARLVSPEQSAALLNQRNAQFVVRDITPQAVLVQQVTGPIVAEEAITQQPDAALALLNGAGLPASSSNLEIARAVLARGLSLTPEIFQSLIQALGGQVSTRRLQRALDLLALGIIPTSGMLDFIGEDAAPSGQVWAELYHKLSQLLQHQSLSASTRAYIEALLRDLALLRMNGENAQELAQHLAHWVRLAGRSLENVLRNIALFGDTSVVEADDTLAGLLLHLEHALAGENLSDLKAELRGALQHVRHEHVLNLPPDRSSGHGEWLVISLPLQWTFSDNAPLEWCSARLRVAARSTAEGRGIDPNYTRLVLEVALARRYVVRLDVSIAGRKIGTRVEVNAAELIEVARAELPGLCEGLQLLGYTVQSSDVVVMSTDESAALSRALVGDARDWVA